MKLCYKNIMEEFYSGICTQGMYTEGTCKSYAKTYIPNLIGNILKPNFVGMFGSNPFDKFNQNIANDKSRALIFALSECLINQEIRQPQLGYAPKTIQNYRSGLRAFFTFMETEGYYFDCSISTQKLRQEVKKLNGKIEYKRDCILNIFTQRLITQDRAYENMIYPARMINNIFNNSTRKNDYHKSLKNVLLGVKFLYGADSSKYEELKNINAITIYPSQNRTNVELHSKKEFTLFTERPDKNYEMMSATGIDELSLDHDVALENILNTPEAQTDYKALKKLSDKYASYVAGKTVTSNYLTNSPKTIRDFKTQSGKCYKKCQNEFTPADIDELYDDFVNLYNKILFTIMLKKYNSSKGKK